MMVLALYNPLGTIPSVLSKFKMQGQSSRQGVDNGISGSANLSIAGITGGLSWTILFGKPYTGKVLLFKKSGIVEELKYKDISDASSAVPLAKVLFENLLLTRFARSK